MGNITRNNLSNNDKIKKSLELILQDNPIKTTRLYGINLSARDNHCAICDNEQNISTKHKHLICSDCIYQCTEWCMSRKCIIFNELEQFHNKYVSIYYIEGNDLCISHFENELLFYKILFGIIINNSHVLLKRYEIFGLKHLKYLLWKNCTIFPKDIIDTIQKFYLSLF